MLTFLAEDDGPPLVAVQVVPPRAYGAAGAPPGAAPTRRANRQQRGKAQDCTEDDLHHGTKRISYTKFLTEPPSQLGGEQLVVGDPLGEGNGSSPVLTPVRFG
jgi:hypothetical protein